jgi:hypothetical protein
MATAARIAANQQNSQLSTGPTTEDGKAKVSKNALKTGLTGHTVPLATDDAELYGKHIESFRKRHDPVGDAETELVQAIADSAWRQARIPSLEASLYAVGHSKFAGLHAEVQDPQTRASLIDGEILIAFERQFRNLSTQEGRLRRQREKDEAALKQLQDKRAAEAKLRLRKAGLIYIDAVKRNDNDDFDLGQFGFEFTLEQIEMKALEISPNLFDPYYAQLREEEAQARRAA